MKKTLALLICLVMLISMFPATASAETYYGEEMAEGWYLVGTTTNWAPQAGTKFSDANTNGVRYLDVTASGSQEFKVIHVNSDHYLDDNSWYPDNNYALNFGNDGQKTYRFFFKQNDYLNHILLWDDTPTPGYYVVGGDNLWGIDSYYHMTQIAGTSKYVSDNALSLSREFKIVSFGGEAAWYPSSNQTAPSEDELYVFFDTSTQALSYANKVRAYANGTALEHGTISINGVAYPGAGLYWLDTFQGDTLTITASPDAGYQLKSISAGLDDVDITSSPITYTVPAAASSSIYFYAEFEEVAPTLTVNTVIESGDQTGSISVDADSYLENATVTITPNPATGYALAWLEVRGATTNTQYATNALSFNMPSENVIIKATFASQSDYYLITSTDETCSDSNRFLANWLDNTSPYILSRQSLLPGTMVQVVQKSGAEITARYPAAGEYFTVPSYYASDANDLNIRFDTVQHTANANNLNWTLFGGYFAWESLNTPYSGAESKTVTVTGNANGAITVNGYSSASVDVTPGTTVTLSATPAEGYEFAGWTVMQGETAINVDANNQFTMPAGDVTVSANFQAISTPSLRSVALKLDGTIGVIFKLSLPTGENAPSASRFTVQLFDGETKKIEKSLNDITPTNGIYEITYSLPARLINNQLKILVLDTSQNNECTLTGSTGTLYPTGYTTSIAACCDSYAQSSDATLSALAQKLRNYGDCAHGYLDRSDTVYITDTMISKLSAASATDLPTITDANNLSGSGLKVKSMFLTLQTDTAINIRFEVDPNVSGASLDGYTFTCSDTSKELIIKTDANSILVTIPNIAANQLNSVFTVNVAKDGVSGTPSYGCSALFYGKLAMRSGADAVKYTVRALYDYNVAADAYAVAHA